MAEESIVVIVGAGPSGLATSACLSAQSIPHIILEKEDSYASLWRKRTYDRLNLHLGKEFCSLPFMPHSSKASTFLKKEEFLVYLSAYVSKFHINPRYNRVVEHACYDEGRRKWRIVAKDTRSEKVEEFVARFLVVATGENGEAHVPKIEGLEGFGGKLLHSREYKSGLGLDKKEVLVVGCGNSGMEIAYDLSNYGARATIVVRSPFHVLTKEMVYFGMRALKFLPLGFVDFVVTTMAKLAYGNLAEYGIRPPSKGPFYLKSVTGRSPVLDVGTVGKIKSGEIKVAPGISRIKDQTVVFENGVEKEFYAIVFATGYKSIANKWLKDYKYVLNENGFPKNKVPMNWKGENNLYCAGLSRNGLFGVSKDAMAIADDIAKFFK